MPKHFDNNRFVPGDTNTICDVTGFKKKASEVVKRWDGFYCIPEASHPRHPQDFPPTILKPRVRKESRFQTENTDEAAAITPI